MGNAIDELKAALENYKDVLVDECIQNILKIQEQEGKLTERDLFIFIRDLVGKVTDVRIK